jgi:hypothetical protein
MTREQKQKLVWKHTHRDYRGKLNGERAILVSYEGDTCPVTNSLTDEQLESRIPRAPKEKTQ